MIRPEQVTDEMTAAANPALYAASVHDLDATDDELRATLAAALNAMPDDLLRELCRERGCVMVPSVAIWELLDALEQVRSARTRGEEDWNSLNDADERLRALLAAAETPAKEADK